VNSDLKKDFRKISFSRRKIDHWYFQNERNKTISLVIIPTQRLEKLNYADFGMNLSAVKMKSWEIIQWKLIWKVV